MSSLSLPQASSPTESNTVPYIKQTYLGGGHFGKVWLEEDKGLNRLCAAKYLDISLLAPGVEAFAEAQAMAEAEHDHVVLIYSAELEAGQPVIRMEYLPDGSVESKHGGMPVPVGEAVRIMVDACRGIEHLHVRGILHRDIKPGNLLITPTNNVKVSDFGLSCSIADASGAPQIAYQPHRPPESVSQESGILTPAGDLYAAGVTAYRLLNGDDALVGVGPPGANPFDLVVKGKFPDRKRWLPHIHDRLRRAIVKAMHVDPAKRFADARAFRKALEQVRPHVSWWPTNPATGLGWEGSAPDGTTWRAVVEQKPKAGYRFTVERRRLGKDWRKRGSDTLDATTEAAAVDHAHKVLSRIAIEGV
ncbi:serine/threonine-protein kinase [Mycobacteroides salmoniphilum]|uniref:serine/threonine-protein kinase n=1 Tax=Mycobacteroides salmoniphilum TaxID=404941 RepID=UPI00177AC8C6|nr:serine/threonine-protein kinase [Mycobacteroides salmoniphilum]